MRTRTIFLFFYTYLLFIVSAQVVKLDVRRVKHPLADPYRIKARDVGGGFTTKQFQEIIDRIQNERFFYAAVVGIGTPPQAVSLLLDTGSSDTWCYTPGSSMSNSQRPMSFFDPSRSRSFHYNETTFQIQYGIGSVQGRWGTDQFRIGNALVNDLSIGIATSGSSQQGIIGIGRPQAESTYREGIIYENLPMKMVSQGLINTAAYSLYLNDINAQSGTILFGGVDLSKFIGSLVALPITHPRHLAVTLQNLRTDGVVRNNLMNSPEIAVLDSGTSLTYFSKSVMNNIHEAFNANPSFAIGKKYYCDCNVTHNMVLDFGSTIINVPNYQFLWPIETIVHGIVGKMVFPPNSCYIGIETIQTDMGFFLIGDDFLRAFYSVYDIQNNQIAIAQVNTNPSGPPRIQAITKNHIPGT